MSAMIPGLFAGKEPNKVQNEEENILIPQNLVTVQHDNEEEEEMQTKDTTKEVG